MGIKLAKRIKLRMSCLTIVIMLFASIIFFCFSCEPTSNANNTYNTWVTFLGGNLNDNNPHGIAVDGRGNVYVCGYSYGTWKGVSDPVRPFTRSHSEPRGTDAFVAKLNRDGKLVWNTFLGDSGNEYCYGIALDSKENIYVSGYCNATWEGDTEPVRLFTSGSDAFVAKLDNSGSLAWNTFLGGSGEDYAWGGIAIDVEGNIYLGGHSNAAWQGKMEPVRAYSSGLDAFAAKLNNDGKLLWNTFLGGKGDDFGRGLAVDKNGYIYLGGHSTVNWQGNMNPVRPYSLGQDAFVAALDNSGALQWNSFLGGIGKDFGWDVALDDSENVYLAGHSTAAWKGIAEPVRAYNSGEDAFAVKLDKNGNLQWNTFMGGKADDLGFGIAVNGNSNVYLSGYSYDEWEGSAKPVRPYTAGQDAFAVELDDRGNFLWNTFLGGKAADLSYGITVDEKENVYQGGYSFAAWELVSPPVRPYTSGADAFVVKLSPSLR